MTSLALRVNVSSCTHATRQSHRHHDGVIRRTIQPWLSAAKAALPFPKSDKGPSYDAHAASKFVDAVKDESAP